MVLLPNTVPPAALLKLKVNAGVVVAVATDVVNRGDNAPALNDVTVPVAAGVAHVGNPPTTVRTCPTVPMGNRAAVGPASS